MLVAQKPLHLLTFAPMVNSELCRLLLTHYAVPYVEKRHIFGWASILALVNAGTLEIPVTYGNGLRLSGARAVVNHFDNLCPDDHKLVPTQREFNTQVERDWLLFNGDMATDTAAFAYYHLLPHREIMSEPFAAGCPRWEAAVLKFGYPLLRALLTLLLHLNAEKAEKAITRIRLMLDQTDKLLSDGRPYMTGERVTLSDFSLSSAIAPLLLPEGYGALMPPLAAMPPAVEATIRDVRQHPTAKYVQRIYARHGSTKTAIIPTD
jgi:glutathione S-transferase